MQNLSLLLQVRLESNIVGLSFGLTEDDGSPVTASVQVDHISDHSVSMGVGARQTEVLYCFGGLHVGVFDQVNQLAFSGQVLLGEVYNPRWDRCRKEQILGFLWSILLDILKDLLNILLKTLF